MSAMGLKEKAVLAVGIVVVLYAAAVDFDAGHLPVRAAHDALWCAAMYELFKFHCFRISVLSESS